jgi:hypothetical protein
VSEACFLKVTFLLPANKFPSNFPYGPDLDNLLKRTLDALQQTVFRNAAGRDSCVIALFVMKTKIAVDDEAGMQTLQRGFQELDEIGLLPLGQSQQKPRIVVVRLTTARRSAALPSWKYGGCCQSSRSGVVGYCLVALRAAYAPSVGNSNGLCRVGTVGTLKTSVKVGGWWHAAHPAAPANKSAPRLAAARLKLPFGGGGVCKLS